MGAVLLDYRFSDLLQLTNGVDVLLSDRFFFRRVTLGYLSKGMGRHVCRLKYKEKSQCDGRKRRYP